MKEHTFDVGSGPNEVDTPTDYDPATFMARYFRGEIPFEEV